MAVSELKYIDIFNSDCRTKAVFNNLDSTRPGGGIRSVISTFSRASRTRLLFAVRNISGLTHFLTVTYPHADYAESASGGNFMTDGRVVKEHLRKLRQYLTRRSLYGVWFLEFQARGAPHYHLFINAPVSENFLPEIRAFWFHLVGSTCPKHQRRGIDFQKLRSVKAAAGYAAKYAVKADQKEVPEYYKAVGRFWGSFSVPVPSVRTYTISPKELHQIVRVARKWTKAQARAQNWKPRKKRSAKVGSTYYYCAPAIREYLVKRYQVGAFAQIIRLQTPYLYVLPTVDRELMQPFLPIVRINKYLAPELY